MRALVDSSPPRLVTPSWSLPLRWTRISRKRRFSPTVFHFRKYHPAPRTNSHTATHAYLPLFLGSWNIQEYVDSNLFWASDGRFYGGFPPFCVFETWIQTLNPKPLKAVRLHNKPKNLSIFYIASMDCIL